MGISITEAIRIAEARRGGEKVNRCVEYKDIYVFSNTNDELLEGGMPGPVAVYKNTGEDIGFTTLMIVNPELAADEYLVGSFEV